MIKGCGECTLFPSREQRDWSKFTAPWYKKYRFDPNTLNAFDNVLCRNDNRWQCNLYSHISTHKEPVDYSFHCMSQTFAYCIPYNDGTKHLVGITDEAPDYYR